VEGAWDRSPRGDQGLRAGVDPDLPGQDRQDAVPGSTPGARRDAAAPLSARYLRAATLRREPPEEAVFVFLVSLPGFLPCASATLALSASIRSITGAFSSAGSGTAISSPASLASTSAFKPRRSSLTRACGSKSAARLPITWR